MKTLMCKQSLPAQSNWLACSKVCFLVKVPSIRPRGSQKSVGLCSLVFSNTFGYVEVTPVDLQEMCLQFMG